MKKIILSLLTISLLASCKNFKFKNDEYFQENIQPVWNDYFSQDFNISRSVDIFVVTNRKSKNDNFGCLQDSFGIESGNKLQFGICKISVPKNHQVGEIILAQNNQQSSNNFFKILEAKNLQQASLIEELKKLQRRPLIFVHGFNVRYQEAILRASQIAYDLKYQGPIILFTWPAGSPEGFFEEKMLNKTYETNQANTRNSIIFFQNFLVALQESNIRPNLLVHSMGHQIVLEVLKNLGSGASKKLLINELILNAPDFEAAKFKTFAKNIQQIAKRTTLYCSYNDKAMLASKTFNKNDRLGACANIENLDVVNVGLVDDSTIGLGHGYYSSREVLTDVFQTLLNIDAEKRLFLIKSEASSAEKYFLRK